MGASDGKILAEAEDGLEDALVEDVLVEDAPVGDALVEDAPVEGSVDVSVGLYVACTFASVLVDSGHGSVRLLTSVLPPN